MESPDPAILEAARAHLPAGVGWLNGPAAFLVACTTGWLLASAGVRAGSGASAPPLHAPWTERARSAHPVRIGARVGIMVGCAIAMILSSSFDGPWARLPTFALGLIAVSGALLGGLTATSRVDRQLGLPSGVAARLRDILVVVLVFFPSVVVANLLALVVTEVGGIPRIAAPVLTIAAIAMLMLHPLVPLRWLGLALPAPERLRTVVERMAHSTGTPLRGGVHVLRWSMANALAFPLSNSVAFTDRAVEALSDEDVEGICAHELAHLREPRRIVAFRTATSVLLAIPAIAWPFVPVIATMPLVFFALVAYASAQRWLQRYELIADAAARQHEPSPGAYGRALEKLHAVNLAPAVMSKTTSHPHLYDRLVALGAQPAFPRPAPPLQSLVRRVTVVVTVVGAVVLVAVHVALAKLSAASPARAVMITGGSSSGLTAYATQMAAEDPAAARALFRGCLAERDWDRTCQRGLAQLGEEP